MNRETLLTMTAELLAEGNSAYHTSRVGRSQIGAVCMVGAPCNPQVLHTQLPSCSISLPVDSAGETAAGAVD